MNSDKLSIDLSVLKRMHGMLTVEILNLQKQTVQLFESVGELDASWDARSMLSFDAEFVSTFNHLNLLIESMKVLDGCMSYALNAYVGCENAAADSVRAIDGSIFKGN